ncbi:sugar-binding transcriptional regulator [Devriesea agamarum]|uniref:sugar-binding transcriptional regulator n=1 Tax=Devriesea agamarum TaxID=472569 RepID=UPI00071C6556|nr:sugar-binding domain-containing protein [Devriesea agamarum]
MPAHRDTDMLVQAARLYYDQGRSQAEIARELDVSRSNVSRILSQARERGIVEITIHDPDAPAVRDGALERALRSRFNLREPVVVAPGPREKPLDVVARTSADLLYERARKVRSIGISWGHTLQDVVSHLRPLRRPSAPVVIPLVGGLSALDTLEGGDSVAQRLADRLGTRAERVYAPAVVESARACETFLQERSIRTVLRQAAAVDLAMVGIGSHGMHSSPHLLQGMNLSQDEYAKFLAQKPVGDMCGQFFDALGKPLGPPTSQRIVGVTLDQLKSIKQVIGVAAGLEKAGGVIGALRSGIINMLVVDTSLAEAVLARS